VVAGSPEIFMYNPNVKKVFNFANPLYFYEDYINDETYVIKEEPYVCYDYLNKNKHLVEVWCDLIGVPCDGINPDLYFIPSELTSAELHIKEVSKRNKDKPIMMFQWVGGKVPEKNEDIAVKQALASMYKRSIPYEEACEIAKALNKDYAVCVVGHTNFPEIPLTEKFFYPLRSTLALLTVKDVEFIGIDSFLQHASASNQINKSGTVLWGGTSHKVLGYDLHKNIYNNSGCPPCHRPNSYLFDVLPTGGIWECPKGEVCMKGFDKVVCK
jgi:hypothetical protein